MNTAKTLRAIAIAAAVAYALWSLANVLLLIFLAVLIAAILCGLTTWTSRKTRLPRPFALACVSVVLIAGVSGLFYYIGPLLVAQGEALWKSLLHQIDELRKADAHAVWLRWMQQRLSALGEIQGPLAASARSVVTLTAGSLIKILVMGAMAIYFALEPDLYLDGIVQLMPVAYRARARKILLDMGKTLVLWSIGQFVDMGIVGALATIGFTLLGMPLAFALAVLAGLLTFIPFFGAILAAIPALVVGLAAGWRTAVWVLVVLVCCHVLEAYIVGPFVQRRTVRLPPALTVLSMTCLGSIFGIPGVVLGAPVAAVLLVLVREAYVDACPAVGTPF